MKIKFDNLDKQAKGKIGEIIIRSYYQRRNCSVFNLEPIRECDIFKTPKFFSGTGHKYINSSYILTPREALNIESNRCFDILTVSKRDKLKFIKKRIDRIKKERNYILIKRDGSRLSFTKLRSKDGLYYKYCFLRDMLNGKYKYLPDLINKDLKRFTVYPREIIVPYYIYTRGDFITDKLDTEKQYELIKKTYEDYETKFHDILKDEGIERKLIDVKFFTKPTTWTPSKQRKEIYKEIINITKENFTPLKTYIFLEDNKILNIQEVKLC